MAKPHLSLILLRSSLYCPHGNRSVSHCDACLLPNCVGDGDAAAVDIGHGRGRPLPVSVNRPSPLLTTYLSGGWMQDINSRHPEEEDDFSRPKFRANVTQRTNNVLNVREVGREREKIGRGSDNTAGASIMMVSLSKFLFPQVADDTCAERTSCVPLKLIREESALRIHQKF